MSQIQKRMEALGVKQVDMILELRKRGITVQPPEMSSIIRGFYTYPKAKRVLDECDRILDGTLLSWLASWKMKSQMLVAFLLENEKARLSEKD